jgi:hypothetical protein
VGVKKAAEKCQKIQKKSQIYFEGGLRYSDKKRFVEFLDKGNSSNFYIFFIVYLKLIYEWVEAGNQGSDFAAKQAKIVIILEHAIFPKKEEYLKKVET